jgi:hypothetical protein
VSDIILYASVNFSCFLWTVLQLRRQFFESSDIDICVMVGMTWMFMLCIFVYHFRQSNPMKAVCIWLVRTKNVKLPLLFLSLSWLSGGPWKFSGVEGCVLYFTVPVPPSECFWTIPSYTQESPYVQYTSCSVCVAVYKPWLLLSHGCFVLLAW